ncbi:YncE family protein [Gulosibacter chungangensis]|uniref:YncE family protein n=1 Tax=Gulosibacter chungangensis TaxID=979746 RepID=A0A7J5BA89_9MICO|nr:hypothetical protein [Gulosibacter chungangensis]KAB1642743.1 hypothetical protein F8O05_09835 [Gulosibacter chungangensis]
MKRSDAIGRSCSLRSSWTKRGLAVTAVAAVATTSAFAANPAMADEADWTYDVTSLETGVNNGYQLAYDDDNDKVYFTDAAWRSETRVEGTADSEPLDWSNVEDDVTSQSSMRTTFSPYGVAVDGKLDGGTIVTTTARARDGQYGGAVVIYTASQGAPTNEDRVYQWEDGTPIFSGVRRIAVDETNHLAYVTNLGNSRGSGPDGWITVLDLTKRGHESVVAQITVPDASGAVGVAVDEANNKIYVGGYAGGLYMIDGNAIDTSNPKSFDLNNGAITKLEDAGVGENPRPTYNADLKRLYVSEWASPTAKITVVDADPASSTYGEQIDQIETGPSNAVEVDGELGILYSANLGDQEVVAFDTETHEELFTVPTSGNALNLGINPDNNDVWVSNFSNSGKTDVISVSEATGETEEPTEPETVETPYGSGDTIAYVNHPSEWVEGTTLKLSGTNWKHPDGTGSTIALKLNAGSIAPKTPIGGDVPDDVWALIEADDDGTWTAEIPFPSSENTNADVSGLVAGGEIKFAFLTGSMKPGDAIRGGQLPISIGAAPAAEEEAPSEADPAAEYDWTVNTYDTGVTNGYQLAYDDDNDRVYFSDAQWRSETRDADTGEITVTQEATGKIVEFNANSYELVANHDYTGLYRNDDSYTINVTQEASGKVVEFDANAKSLTQNHDYTGLTRNDGSGLTDADPFDWSNVEDDVTSQSSMRTTFSPYGIAVDGKLDGGTIVTTTARARDGQYGGAVVVYSAQDGAPTDADRIFEWEDGSQIFSGVRRIAVDETNHLAYITNLGNSRGNGPDGWITVLDLTKRGAESVLAQITVPDAAGAVGVAVDEANNLIYVGGYAGGLYVIDGNAIDTSDPRSFDLNNGAITKLEDAGVGENPRPTYNADLKRLYVSQWASPQAAISVVDADPESDTYGLQIEEIITGPSNAVEVDGEYGILYSANLGDQEVVAFDTETHEVLFTVPTSGNALNIGINPDTHDVWVSNFSNSGITDIISVKPAGEEEPGKGDENGDENGAENGNEDGAETGDENGAADGATPVPTTPSENDGDDAAANGSGSGSNGSGDKGSTDAGNKDKDGNLASTGAEMLPAIGILSALLIAGAALLTWGRKRGLEQE